MTSLAGHPRGASSPGSSPASSPASSLAVVLSAAFGERLVLPSDERYAAACQVWNGEVVSRPLAVVRCAGPAEVATAVRAARDAGVPLSVKGGGHQIAGAAVRHDGLVIDLAPLRGADVCARTGTVRVGGGALLSDLDRACARYGVVVPAGVVSHTGVGGLALGGGIGWLCRSRGLTCDALVEATVVDAAGATLRVSQSSHPDLFWALRGGGGNFGAVVELRLRTAPIGPVTYGVDTVPLAGATAALARYQSMAGELPRELQVLTRLQRFAGHHVDADPHGEPVLTVEWLWSGDPARAHEMTSLLASGTGRHEVGRRRFASVQGQQDQRFPHGDRYVLKPGHLRELGPGTVTTMVDAIASAPPGDPQIEVLQLGGAICDVDEDATAFPRRDARFALNVSSRCAADEDAGRHQRWTRATHAALTAGGDRGAYANFVGPGGPTLEDVFGPAKLRRLREVKRRYDPDDVFAAGAHIRPAAS